MKFKLLIMLTTFGLLLSSPYALACGGCSQKKPPVQEEEALSLETESTWLDRVATIFKS